MSDCTSSYNEQGPSWEANSTTGSQEIHHILWHAKVHCRIHTSLPLVSVLSQINPDQNKPINLCLEIKGRAKRFTQV